MFSRSDDGAVGSDRASSSDNGLLLMGALGLGAASLPDATPGHTLLILVQFLAFIAAILILLFFERRRQPRGATR